MISLQNEWRFLSELKLKLIVQKIQNHRNKWVQHGQRRTTTLNYEISTMWKTQPRMTPPKTSRLLMGQEEFPRPKSLQTKWWWWWITKYSLLYLVVPGRTGDSRYYIAIMMASLPFTTENPKYKWQEYSRLLQQSYETLQSCLQNMYCPTSKY